MSATCLLALLLTCGSPGSRMLHAASVGAAVADTWSTQRVFGWAKEAPGRQAREGDPLMRPFQEHGPAVAWATTYGALLAGSWVEQRFDRPKLTKVLRVVQIGFNVWGARGNVQLRVRLGRH